MLSGKLRWLPLALSLLCVIAHAQEANLQPGKAVEREIAGGESHAYQVTIAGGQYVHFRLDQRAIDATRARAERLKPQLDSLREQYAADPKRLEEETNKLYAVNPVPATPLSVLIDHIDHIAKVAGVNHVGLGSDFDGIPSLPVGIEDVSKLPNITYELLRRGYSEEDVRKILGENLLRVMAEAERVARASSRSVSGEGSLQRLNETKR